MFGETRPKSTLDLDRVIFDGDRELREALLGDKRFVRVVVSRMSTSSTATARRQLLLSALRLSPAVAPEPSEALAHVVATLGIETPVELYCVAERSINAFVVSPRPGGVLLLGLTSEAIERLDPGELRFVLGHELGHALFDHFHLAPEELAGDENVSPVHLARLCAWMRYAELSADRVGLLCCDDFETAVRAFFKLTSGLSAPRFLRHAEEHAEQLAAVTAENIESDEGDWFSTHPYSPLRVKALDLFSRSTTYHSLLGRSAGEARFHRLLGKSGALLDEAELEREVSGIMRLMDPSFLREVPDETALVREFLALAGMRVALADGSIARGEREVLGSRVGKRGLVRKAEELLKLSPDEHEEKLAALAQKLSLALSPLRRKKVIEDLVAVALADRKLAVNEVEVLGEMAALLGVSSEFVEQALARATASVD